jgi:hypothetical protein
MCTTVLLHYYIYDARRRARTKLASFSSFGRRRTKMSWRYMALIDPSSKQDMELAASSQRFAWLFSPHLFVLPNSHLREGENYLQFSCISTSYTVPLKVRLTFLFETNWFFDKNAMKKVSPENRSLPVRLHQLPPVCLGARHETRVHGQ